MVDLVKVKIVFTSNYDEEDNATIAQACMDTEWMEMPVSDLKTLQDYKYYISSSCQKYHGMSPIIVVEPPDPDKTLSSILKYLNVRKKADDEKAAKDEKKRLEAKKKREAAKKKKQEKEKELSEEKEKLLLEQLQKKYGNG